MIAGLVALMLLIELGLVTSLACWLWIVHGVPGALAALAGAVVFCALPFGLVALACALARRWRAAASAPLGAVGFMRLAAGETLAFMRIYVVDQLLQPWVAPANPRRIVRGVVPILFVHGIYCNAGVWHRQIAHLRREGIANLFCLNLTPPAAGIDHFAAQFARRAAEVCRACDVPMVIIVAHSMGGLVARAWYARLRGHLQAARMVTIGTPHRGSQLARAAPGRCAAEMIPGSEWLARLEVDETRAPGTPSLCIFSWHDSLVAPQDSAQLPGANVLALERLGHLQLLLDPAVHRKVAAEIAAARSESPS
jgi:pimeloyl-ACP methyl ester carboxylesterase